MFTIDFTKPWLYKDIIYFNQGNLSTNNTLRCKLITGGSDDFTGGSIACTFTTKDSVEISGFGKLIDAKNGIIDIVFPSNALVVGTNKLEVLVNRVDGGVAQSPPVMYDIWQGLTTGKGIEAETNYPILIELINSTNEASNKANLALNKANSMITDITDAIDNAYRSANEADIATSNANTKIEEVETAKTEMIKKVDTSIDTMKLSVEDAKSDMQATTDAKMQQVDNSIVAMKSDVENAKNEMSSKADEKIADIDRALATGTVDLELKASRDGEESLPARLKRDLYIDEVPVKQRVLNLENMKEMQDLEYSTDKGYAVCEKTGNGTVKDLKIYGKSLINLKNEVFKYENVYIAVTFKYDLQPNKTYTVILNGFNKDNFRYHVCYNGDGSQSLYSSSEEIVKFTTPSDLINNGRRIYTYPKEGYTITQNDIDTLKPIILEGDHTQNPPGYFEGIASVGNGNEIEVSSFKSDGNLFDMNWFKDNGIDNSNVYISNLSNANLTPTVKFEDNTIYYFKVDAVKLSGTGELVLQFHYKNGTTKYQMASQGVYKSDGNSVDHISFSFSTDAYYNIKDVCVSKENIPFQPIQQDKKTPLFKDVDGTWKPILNARGIDERNCDVIDTTKNIFEVKYEEVVMNGNPSENWVKKSEVQSSTKTQFVLANYTDKLQNETVVLCDKLPWEHSFADKEHVWVNGSGINIVLDNTKASTIEQLKTYLQINNITCVVKNKVSKTYELNPIYPEAFEDETLMLFKTGPISTRATWKITSNLVGVLGNVNDRVKRMENDFYKYTVTQNRLQLGTTYSSDRTTFRVDTATFSTEKAKQDLDYDLFRLLRHNILVGPQNYDKAEMENMMDFYVSVGKIDYNMWDELYMLIEEQHNPPVEEEAPVI